MLESEVGWVFVGPGSKALPFPDAPKQTRQAPGWKAATRHTLTHFTHWDWAPHMTAPRSCGVPVAHKFSGVFNSTYIRSIYSPQRVISHRNSFTLTWQRGETYPHPAAAPDIFILKLVSLVNAPRRRRRNLCPNAAEQRGEPPLFPLREVRWSPFGTGYPTRRRAAAARKNGALYF